MNKLIAIALFALVAVSQQRELPSKAVPFNQVPRGRIEGGEVAVEHAWPYQGWLGSNSVNCGCVLASENWILTAAHCVDAGGNTATFGDHQISTEDTEDEVKVTFTQEDVTLGTGWGSTAGESFAYDIAVINIASNPVEVKDGVIEYAILTTAVPAPGTMATLTGWGAVVKFGSASDFLKQAELDIVESSVCDDFYSDLDYTDKYFICLEDAEKENSSCNGDSGGPLNYQEEEDGVWKVGGITSFGSGGTCAGAPVGYSSINKFACFIETATNREIVPTQAEGYPQLC